MFFQRESSSTTEKSELTTKDLLNYLYFCAPVPRLEAEKCVSQSNGFAVHFTFLRGEFDMRIVCSPIADCVIGFSSEGYAPVSSVLGRLIKDLEVTPEIKFYEGCYKLRELSDIESSQSPKAVEFC